MQDPKKRQKIRHLGTITQLCRAIPSQLRHVSTIGKKLLNSHVSPTHPNNMVNFGPLAAEICWRVWGTPAHFNGFRVLAALLHGTVVVGVSQTLRRWTEGATYIRQAAITLGIGTHSSMNLIFIEAGIKISRQYIILRSVSCWCCHWSATTLLEMCLSSIKTSRQHIALMTRCDELSGFCAMTHPIY